MKNNDIGAITSSNGGVPQTSYQSDDNLNIQNGFSVNNAGQNRNEDPRLKRRVEIYFTMQKGIHDHGWQRGVDSGDVTANPETELILKEHARAMAEDAFRENFNPIDSLHDKSRQLEFEKCLEEIVEAKQALLNEKSKIKEVENAAAKAKSKVLAAPEFPIALVVVAIPLITLTVAFTLYDSFVTSLGFILALTFSLLAGLCWGAFISYLILHKYHTDGSMHYRTNSVGLLAGVGMAIALGFIRFSQSSPEFLWLVLGLTLLEIFIVIGLEFFARRYRSSLLEHNQKTTIAEEAQGDSNATKGEIQRRQERVNELQNKIDEHLSYLDERELRAKQKDQFVASAEKAVIDGYRGAVAKNKGINIK